MEQKSVELVINTK